MDHRNSEFAHFVAEGKCHLAGNLSREAAPDWRRPRFWDVSLASRNSYGHGSILLTTTLSNQDFDPSSYVNRAIIGFYLR